VRLQEEILQRGEGLWGEDQVRSLLTKILTKGPRLNQIADCRVESNGVEEGAVREKGGFPQIGLKKRESRHRTREQVRR